MNDIYLITQNGTYKEFEKLYKKSDAINIDSDEDMTIIQHIVLNNENSEDRIKMLDQVIKDGANVNYLDNKYKRNALHLMYMNFRDRDYQVILKITEILIDAGIDVNAKDAFNNIPLNYAICELRNTTEELKQLYELLLENGSEYKNIDKFGKSCLDYAKEYSWRNGFLDIVKEFENGNKK